MTSSKYRKSFILDAKYFLQNVKGGVVGQYNTNSLGKRFVSASIETTLGGKLNMTSYQELKDVIEMLTKIKNITKGKWYFERKVKKDE